MLSYKYNKYNNIVHSGPEFNHQFSCQQTLGLTASVVLLYFNFVNLLLLLCQINDGMYNILVTMSYIMSMQICSYWLYVHHIPSV